MTVLVAIWLGAIVVFSTLLGLYLAAGVRNPNSCDRCQAEGGPLSVSDGELLCDGCLTLLGDRHA